MGDHAGHSFAAYFKRAVSPLAVLAVLKDREMYGYEINREIHRLSDGKLSLALLYPVMYRLEEQGFVETTHVSVENGRARNYYRATPAGKEHLKKACAEFRELSDCFITMIEEE